MQKFHKGDLVRVTDDLGPCMRHFRAGVDAIVIGSYKDKYGGSNTNSYTLHLKGTGETSWYEECQLTLLKTGCLDLLAEWKAQEKAELKILRDKEWIFGQEWSEDKTPQGASIEVLAADLGCSNMWGSHGEGFQWYANAVATLGHAMPFLISKDREGWDKYANSFSNLGKGCG